MKFLKKFKKGFTLVELVVVIAVIAILAAISVVSYIAITKRARQTVDNELVAEVNRALIAGDKPQNMSDALENVSLYGFEPEKFRTRDDSSKYAYSLSQNKFVVLDKDGKVTYPSDFADVSDEDLWLFADTKAEAESGRYSWYLRNNELSGKLSVKGSFDAGKNTNITEVEYDRSEETVAKKSILRTNGGLITVNAPLDEIKHFGEGNVVNLKAVASSSYYEHGKVGQVKIKKGRLVLTNTVNAIVESIYLESTDDSYDGITLATQPGAELPEMIARDSVSLPTGETPKTVVTIQTNVNEEGKNPEKQETINLYATQGTSGNDVYEATNGYNVSNLALLVVEASSDDAKAQAAEQISDPVVVSEISEAKASVVVMNATQLQDELDKGTRYIIIGDDFNASNNISVTSSTVIEGRLHTISTTASRILWVNNSNVNLHIKDLTFAGGKKAERGIQVNSNKVGYNITLDNVHVSDVTTYAINMCGGTTGKLTANHSSFSGWNALNIWNYGHNMIFNDCVLTGTNDKTEHSSNAFATICFEADTTYQVDEYSSFNTVTLNRCTVNAIETNRNVQRIVHFNSGITGSTGNKLITNDCSFVSANHRAYHDGGSGNSWVNNDNELILSVDADISGLSIAEDGNSASGTVKFTLNGKQISFNLSSVEPQPWSNDNGAGTDYVFEYSLGILTYMLDLDIASCYPTSYALYLGASLNA